MSAHHTPGAIVTIIGFVMVTCGGGAWARTWRGTATASDEPKAGPKTEAYLAGQLAVTKWIALAGFPIIIVGLIILAV